MPSVPRPLNARPAVDTEILRNTLVTGVLSALALALGVLVQAAIAQRYGTSAELDAYWIAVSLTSWTVGVFTSSVADPLVPQYLRRDSMDERAHLAGAVLSISLLSGGIVGAVTYVFAPMFVMSVAPGFDASTVAVAQGLIALLAFYPVAAYPLAVATGLLSAQKSFAPAKVIALLSPGITVAVIGVAGETLGTGALAWATLLAAVAQLVLLAALLPRAQVALRPTLRLGSLGDVGFHRSTLPIVVGASIGALGMMVERSVASRLGEGAIAALAYADGLHGRITALLFVPVSTVVFPYLAGVADLGEFNRRLRLGLRTATVLLLPIGLFIATFSHEVVAVLLLRGRFTAGDAEAVALPLSAFMLWLVPYALQILVVRGLVVRHSLWFLVALAAAGLGLKYSTLEWLVSAGGLWTIPLFNALFNILSLCLSLVRLFGWGAAGARAVRETAGFVFRTGGTALPGLLVALALHRLLAAGEVPIVPRLVASSVSYGAVFLVLGELTRLYPLRAGLRDAIAGLRARLAQARV